MDDEPDKYIEIPHRNDLDLGKRLVLVSTEQDLAEKLDAVRRIYRSRGAYGRFKALLEQTGQLDAWHRYEDTQTRAALREWCVPQDIALED